MAKKKKRSNNWIYWVVAEVAFFAFFYYVQYLLRVETNLWLSTLVLWALINISIISCPVVRKCYK